MNNQQLLLDKDNITVTDRSQPSTSKPYMTSKDIMQSSILPN